VIEARVFPTAGVVAARALTAVMVGRLIFGMARLAVCRSGRLVIEAGRLPGICAMTARTLATVMVGWFVAAVTRLAVRRPGSLMIELGRSLPGAGGMAV